MFKPEDEVLMPCPFCGGEAEGFVGHAMDEDEFPYVYEWVKCLTCGAHTDEWEPADFAANKAWNRGEIYA